MEVFNSIDLLTFLGKISASKKSIDPMKLKFEGKDLEPKKHGLLTYFNNFEYVNFVSLPKNLTTHIAIT